MVWSGGVILGKGKDGILREVSGNTLVRGIPDGSFCRCIFLILKITCLFISLKLNFHSFHD